MTVPDDVLADLVQQARRWPAGLGRSRLVCIDGPAGSGKTTLAAQLAEELDATVVHMDDLYAGWTGLDAGVTQLLGAVLEPLGRGEPGSYRRFDWMLGEYAETCPVPAADVVVVEGCGSASLGTDAHHPLIIWVEAPDDERLARGLERDGRSALDHWRAFMVQERAHYAANDTARRAHVHVDGSGNRVARIDGPRRDPLTSVPTRDWYARDTLFVAEDLLGMYVTSRTDEGTVTARITEVEAYLGAHDPGSHAYRGRTARNSTMFGPVGHLYVYRHLGLHSCMNVVAGPADVASGILLRAATIVDGHELATSRRTRRGVVRRPDELASGPARLTVALGIDFTLDGVDVTEPDGRIVVHGLRSPEDEVEREVRRGPRVGVSGPGGDGDAYPWRLWLAGEPTVSTYRAAPARPGRSRRVPRVPGDTAD